LGFLVEFTISSIDKLGEFGVFLLMVLESANIPIPSEVIMPFAGFLAASGRFNFWLIVFVGAFGNLVGSWVSYFVALKLDRRFKKIREGRDFKTAERWFKRFGEASIFWGRFIPVVRTFISFPAGVFKMNFWKFSVLTFFGSLIWTWLMTYIGFFLGERWDILGPYFKQFDLVIAGILGIGFVWWLWHHFRRSK